MHDIIKQLQHQRLVWRGNEPQSQRDTLSTGYSEWDQQLNGGLPRNGVVEIQTELGIGELRLLQRFMQNHTKGRLMVFIQPPGVICAESLANQGFDLANVLVISPKNHNGALWAAEQCLKSGACDCVLLWQQNLEIHQAKRLQMASESGDCIQFIFKPQQHNVLPLPVTLSMTLSPHQYGLTARITKRKGGWLQGNFNIDMSDHWPALTLTKPSNTIVPFPHTKRGAQ